jgi:hypothetical protein
VVVGFGSAVALASAPVEAGGSAVALDSAPVVVGFGSAAALASAPVEAGFSSSPALASAPVEAGFELPPGVRRGEALPEVEELPTIRISGAQNLDPAYLGLDPLAGEDL